MDVLTQIMSTSMVKMDNFLEQVTMIVTEYLAQNDPQSVTMASHDNLYNMSIIAQWFHLVPHVDIKLRPLPANITFDPNDNEYLESLGILVALPGFWLILTLLFFLIFFLCRCCDGSGGGADKNKQQYNQPPPAQHHTQIGKSSKPKKLTGCKLCLALVATITGAAIMLGLLGTIIVHRGMIKLRSSTTDIANVLETVQNDTRTVSNELREHIDVNVESLQGAIETMQLKSVASNFQSHFFFLKRNVTKCKCFHDEFVNSILPFALHSITQACVASMRYTRAWIDSTYGQCPRR